MNIINLLNYFNNETFDQYKLMNIYKDEIGFRIKFSNRIYKKKYIDKNQFGIELIINR
jgi:hypothetical protein